MRHIKKGAQPKDFSDWIELSNDNWQPGYDNLSGKVKKSVYQALLKEQGHLCCYCERELFSGDFHIEHLHPQSLHEESRIDFGNFLVSCLDKTAKGDPLHCGKLKGDEEISIHPLQIDCHSKFTFTASGEIHGTTEDAEGVVKILGLNIKKLIDMRAEAISPFLDEKLDEEDFLLFVVGYLKLSDSGRLSPFHSMIKHIFQ